MSRTVKGVITLTAVDVTSLNGTVDHYHVTATEAGGAVVGADAPKDATDVSFVLDAGSWVVTVTAMAADNTALTQPVTASPSPLVVTDVTTVNVPLAFTLALV